MVLTQVSTPDVSRIGLELPKSENLLRHVSVLLSTPHRRTGLEASPSAGLKARRSLRGAGLKAGPSTGSCFTRPATPGSCASKRRRRAAGSPSSALWHPIMPVGRQPHSKTKASGSDAAALPSCADCGRLQHKIKHAGKAKLRLGPIPPGCLLANKSDRKSRLWCDKCRGQYDRRTALRTMPVCMEQGMVMPVSRSLRIVHGGVTTDPVQLLQDNAKYVPFRLNGETVEAAVEIVSCTAASTLLTIGCGCSAEDAQKIKSRARAGELV